jgi:hypothetical protein
LTSGSGERPTNPTVSTGPRVALAVGAILVGAVSVSAGLGAAGAASSSPGASSSRVDSNPCKNPDLVRKRQLLCPDLRMRPPFDIQRDRSPSGTPILRAGNSIDSVGDGPAELRGKRSGGRTMRARQRVQKRGRGHAHFDTGATIILKHIPDQGPYWKFRNAARFELWALNADGERTKRADVGPKQIYCLRDFDRTHPKLRRSPERRVYPSCSQDRGLERVTIGTSVGWSDVYPATYHEQWVKLTDLPRRGCYAYVHIADPHNGIYELDETNNEASTVVFLSERGRYKPGRCEGVRDEALAATQTADDTEVPSSPHGGY